MQGSKVDLFMYGKMYVVRFSIFSKATLNVDSIDSII